ncbi:DUF6208 family protein [Cyanobacterium sp. IPPAS B-1200]|uniref:DUF6208 family protein n=1 Tax=Cyanobacterium sp. IPPAS B-1200 TaxID=1562720 RepID=UPI00085256DC|nr:DUF6208 family protein [Cyanobacterium sp. IPPAS B-1200]OEJ79773.1 hypothetical protein A5482_09165 [Cyanobacterium sp. IPPAS B-1200]
MSIKNVGLIIEIPLAISSFIFAKVNKFLIGNLYTIYLKVNQKKANQWRVIDNQLVSSPINMGVLMTKAPRWNTHAIIGTLGPFFVEDELSLEVASANASAKSWFAIFYDFPNYNTIDTIASKVDNQGKKWQSIKLKKGKYTIGLRYYNYGDKLTLPAVKIDRKEFTSSKEIPNDSNEFYHSIISKKNWYFLAIHYYIYTVLSLRKYLPESFVKYEFLPVGAIDTKFYYDALDKGEILTIEVNQNTLNKYGIYITIYDRTSLPIQWFQLKDLTEKTKPVTNKGYYLIRVRNQGKPPETFTDLEINLRKSSNH